MKRWIVVILTLSGLVLMSNCYTRNTESQNNNAQEIQEIQTMLMTAMELQAVQLQSIAGYIESDVKLNEKQSKDTQVIGESLVSLKQHLDKVYERLGRIETRLEHIQRTLNQK